MDVVALKRCATGTSRQNPVRFNPAESLLEWRRKVAEQLGLRDYDPAELLPLPGSEGRLLLVNAMGDYGVELSAEVMAAIAGAIARVQREHWAPAP